MPCRHPSEAMLFSYASGSLSECLSLAVATHVTLCPDCARSVAALEATAGALLVAAESKSQCRIAGALSSARSVISTRRGRGEKPRSALMDMTDRRVAPRIEIGCW